ncbi:branched-chain amino acid ABC transporter permease [Pusillimonas sp. DMV24BSW_D]|uniref:branched-chain amino acid ABC transporter permease n=1 Tax=Neopusillimonas aestuarii TaxID=2716226 RepID=UPI00140B069D|nr:branched-chain amino acid ABC transporter permease [Pusillimonas sp. DMV24BSW_D]QIM47852.1 branched-chain amino acid ABC transporter permease [Pusillimonas sp. DMV24BSW_D]
MQDVLFQQLINWLTLGCIYSLLALGFSLLFGVLQVIHFSHGDVALVAPFVALAAVQIVAASLGADASWLVLGAACLIAIVAVGWLGVGLDKLVISRFRDSPAMMPLVATVALGIVLRELIRHVYPEGSNPHAFPAVAQGSITTPFGAIPMISVVSVLVSVGLVIALLYVLHRTPAGMRLRAVSQDRETARLFAIASGPVFRRAFFIASAIGAVGGIFMASYAGVVRFDFGIQAGLIGFSAAVVGGLGRLGGAIIGALLIAAIETIVQGYVPNGTSYRLVFVFALVILVLVFRPAGLFGSQKMEKV